VTGDCSDKLRQSAPPAPLSGTLSSWSRAGRAMLGSKPFGVGLLRSVRAGSDRARRTSQRLRGRWRMRGRRELAPDGGAVDVEKETAVVPVIAARGGRPPRRDPTPSSCRFPRSRRAGPPRSRAASASGAPKHAEESASRDCCSRVAGLSVAAGRVTALRVGASGCRGGQVSTATNQGPSCRMVAPPSSLASCGAVKNRL
jgi:hypothetical protein